MICRPYFQTKNHFPDLCQDDKRRGSLSPNKNKTQNQNCKFPIPNPFFAAGISNIKFFKNNILLPKTPLVPAGIRGWGFGDSLSLRTRGKVCGVKAEILFRRFLKISSWCWQKPSLKKSRKVLLEKNEGR